VAQTQAAPVTLMSNHRSFFSLLDRADLPRRTKRSLHRSLEALFRGYDEDDESGRIEPSERSLNSMLAFLSHPHHQDWASPAISLTGEGMFAAIWQRPSEFRWILEFGADGEFEDIFIDIGIDGRMARVDKKGRVGPTHQAPVSEAKLKY
jgi:hypothetical protein